MGTFLHILFYFTYACVQWRGSYFQVGGGGQPLGHEVYIEKRAYEYRLYNVCMSSYDISFDAVGRNGD